MNSTAFISQISLSGYPPLEISVEISDENLLRYNLTFDQIIRAIQNNNHDISGGQIRSDDEELLIRLRSRSADPDKIGDIILTGNVEKLPEEDLDAITDFARDYIEKFNEEDNSVKIVMSRAYLDIIENRLSLLTTNGFIGLILIIISLGLFLSFRLSLWVAFGIPFSFLAMFIFAYFMGVTINTMSIFGMILVIGILVDDGIVIAENIYQHFEMGKSPRQAAVDGAMEVMPAVLTSVSTTLIAFAPLLFLTGTRMEMMFEMALMVIGALAFSLFEAFLVLPAHLGNKRVLNVKIRNRKSRGIKKYSEGLIIWLRDNDPF